MITSDPIEVLESDALSGLRSLAAASVQVCLTSPPFYLLRRVPAPAAGVLQALRADRWPQVGDGGPVPVPPRDDRFRDAPLRRRGRGTAVGLPAHGNLGEVAGAAGNPGSGRQRDARADAGPALAQLRVP